MSSSLSTAVAAAVMVVVMAATIWASLRASVIRDFQAMIARPWGIQVVADFYGLEVVLALWMISHAAQAGSWVALAVCLVLMPVFGSTAAAAYWIFAVA